MKAFFAAILLFGCVYAQAQNSFTVYFDFDQHQLTAAGRTRLDSFVMAAKLKRPDFSFIIDGYCDSTGSDGYNQMLSENRVASVKQYLLTHGIEGSVISEAKGHGEYDPLNENKTKAERQLNRRVTITITPATQSTTATGEKPLTGKDEKSLTEKFADTASKAGTHIVIRNINFYGGTPFLLPESSPILDELIEIMRVNRNLVIEIQGHICCIATPNDAPYNGTGNGLSEERAKMIYAELIGKGIEASRVSYKGFGHSMPIYPFPEQNEEERIANRRVEIKIVSR